jgi:hypothetical protein
MPCLPLSTPTHPQIVSGSRDKTIRLWNTLGECKFTIAEPEGHTEWVSCVRFSPMVANPIIVSGGWDKLVKVFSLTNCKLRNNLVGHTGYINTVTVSPDGSLCASGGKVRGGLGRQRDAPGGGGGVGGVGTADVCVAGVAVSGRFWERVVGRSRRDESGTHFVRHWTYTQVAAGGWASAQQHCVQNILLVPPRRGCHTRQQQAAVFEHHGIFVKHALASAHALACRLMPTAPPSRLKTTCNVQPLKPAAGDNTGGTCPVPAAVRSCFLMPVEFCWPTRYPVVSASEVRRSVLRHTCHPSIP